MKKLLIIFLTTIYAFSALGVTLHFFYCCQKLSNVSFSSVVEPIEQCKPSTKGCCTNKTVSIKITTDQEKSNVHSLTVPSFTIVPPVYHYYFATNSFVERSPISKHPIVFPPPNQPSRQIMYCIFRI